MQKEANLKKQARKGFRPLSASEVRKVNNLINGEFFGNSLEYFRDLWLGVLIWKLFVNSIRILWEFFGNSLGILLGLFRMLGSSECVDVDFG